MQVFFGFLWNLSSLSLQNLRLTVLSFSPFPAGIRTFLTSHVSATQLLGACREESGARGWQWLAFSKGLLGGTQFELTSRKRMSNKINSCAKNFNAPGVISCFWETWSQHSAEEKDEAPLFDPAWASPAPGWPPGLCVRVEGQSRCPTAGVSPRAAVAVAVPCWLVTCPAVLGWPLSPCAVEAVPLFINISQFTAWGNWN